MTGFLTPDRECFSVVYYPSETLASALISGERSFAPLVSMLDRLRLNFLLAFVYSCCCVSSCNF